MFVEAHVKNKPNKARESRLREVIVNHNNENGEVVFAVASFSDVELWLGAWGTRKEVTKACKENGWKVHAEYCQWGGLHRCPRHCGKRNVL